MVFLSVSTLLKSAGASPLVQAATIILGTFILEDAATVLTGIEVQAGGIRVAVALPALYSGIVLGDLGLYGMGRLAALVPRINRLVSAERHVRGREWLSGKVFKVVMISRFVPGARLPTYTACGFLKADVRQFVIAAVLATSIWTTLLFLLSMRVGQFLMQYVGVWRWVGAIGFALVVVVAGRIIARVQDGST